MASLVYLCSYIFSSLLDVVVVCGGGGFSFVDHSCWWDSGIGKSSWHGHRYVLMVLVAMNVLLYKILKK